MPDEYPMEKIRFVVPAQPGYFVLIPETREGAIVGAGREPVIAWAIDHLGCANPTTLDGVQFANCVVLTPDGKVEDIHGSFTSVDDWIEVEIRLYQNRQQAPRPAHSMDGLWSA